MALEKDKRKKYIVDRVGQSKYAIMVVVYLMVFTIFLTLFIYMPTLWILGSENYLLDAQVQAAREFFFLEKHYLPALVLTMFIMGLHSVIVTHRFFGPIQRFKSVTKNVISGDFSKRIKLRKHDFLKDFQDEFNQMLDSIENRRKEINLISTKSSLVLTELLNDMEKGTLSAAEVGNKTNEALGRMKKLASLTEPTDPLP